MALRYRSLGFLSGSTSQTGETRQVPYHNKTGSKGINKRKGIEYILLSCGNTPLVISFCVQGTYAPTNVLLTFMETVPSRS